jgi:NAD-dependent deacetylase
MSDPRARAARLLAESQRLVVLTGAGVSAESGIPTFRGAGGLWRGLDPMRLATPQAFDANPKLVWEFYNWRRGIVSQAEPNAAHRAIAAMADLVPSFLLVTQNVDRLHQRAGSRNVQELHGNLQEVRCSVCGQTDDPGWAPLPALPTCDVCGGLLRPGVVWFGEGLPPTILENALNAALEADLLLVVGTSAAVFPAAGLIDVTRSAGGSVIEVNLDTTEASGRVSLSLFGPAGEVLPPLVASAFPNATLP